ncbi:MAG: CpaF family protein [Lachnospiraceae bacterium]|nr:CpaF family protein [Lachnospiraceae bacterium]
MEGKDTYQLLKKRLQAELLKILQLGGEWSDEEIMDQIDDLIVSASKNTYLSGYRKLMMKQELFNSVRRLDLLQELVDDKEISEIMVNGMGDIFYERHGHIYRWDKSFESNEKLEDVIQQIVAGANRQVNEASPIVDARLSDGSRVNVVLKPIALNGPILTIRKFPEKPMDMERLIHDGAITQEAADYLKQLVKAKYNIFISGGTSTGKTTMLNALMQYVPSDERVVTIEDSAELQIHNIKNLVKLEARSANVEGEHQISIRDLIKSAMRMRPDRIIVGEVRGPESVDMIQAMSSGHDGSISTGHSGSPEEMLSRLETMILMGMDIPLIAIRKQIASAIDIVIQLERLRDKSRRVTEITEIIGYEEGEIKLNPLFIFKEQVENNMIREEAEYMGETSRVQGTLVASGNRLIHRKKLENAAIKLRDEM